MRSDDSEAVYPLTQANIVPMYFKEKLILLTLMPGTG